MKYTAAQKFKSTGIIKKTPIEPEVKIKDGFFIIESKMNYDVCA